MSVLEPNLSRRQNSIPPLRKEMMRDVLSSSLTRSAGGADGADGVDSESETE